MKGDELKDIGLLTGLRAMNSFFKSDQLHYGYWEPGVEVHISNLKQAQLAYSRLLQSFIPTGVGTILDVGCGSGRTAFELTQLGYKVECVSPSDGLSDYAEQLLRDTAPIYRTRFEEFETPQRYDLNLFSESFQYVNLDRSLEKAVELLNPNGYILIGDFFKRDGLPEKSLIGGGHSVSRFRQALERSDLRIVEERDISDAVAPTIDIFNALSLEVVRPLCRDLAMLARQKWPLIHRFLGWKYGRKLRLLENKYFSGHRSGEHFRKHKIYLIALIQSVGT